MSLKRLVLSPTAVVGATALTVVAVFTIASYVGLRAKVADPHVTMEIGRVATNKPTSAGQTVISEMINGEVARTAERIGEATSLTFAAILYVANEELSGRTPRDVSHLLAGITKLDLMPPGLVFTKTEGVLASSCGSSSVNCRTLSVRYRPMPLSIEVVSIGSSPDDGPALIVRVPDETSDQGEAKLFVANTLEHVKVPAPFASDAEVIALGWSPERWQSLK